MILFYFLNQVHIYIYIYIESVFDYREILCSRDRKFGARPK